MNEQFSRTANLLGADNMERLFNAKIALFGVGGVGGYCAEALARTGIGSIDLFDGDRVCLSNLNRQIIATTKTVGQYKVDVMRDRILEINPTAKVGAHRLFYLPETADQINFSAYDYIIDAVDTMTAKLELVSRANELGVPVISSMGAAYKMDASAFKAADIYETSVCPMARIMRRELRKRNISALKVVYSTEEPIEPRSCEGGGSAVSQPEEGSVLAPRRQTPASNAFVPPAAGLIMAGEVIKDLIAFNR